MAQISGLAFTIDRSAPVPVFEQICGALRARIASGALGEGARLPATRTLATELGVSRSTVVTAYEQLTAEGYLQSRQGSGYTVCGMGAVEMTAPPRVRPRAAGPGPSAPRPFAAGQPDMRLFPYRQWAKAVARVCRTRPEAMLETGSAFGNLQLRSAIAAHVAEWRGITADPGQIIVTAGATDALEICLRSLCALGDPVGIEDPGYQPLRRFAESQGLRPVFLPVDGGGAAVPGGREGVRLVVLTPSHQYPLGGAMPPGRRQAFLHWAGETGGWVIDDDYDSEFRYAGRPIPAMAGFDGLNRTIYVGSFSKIFSNALRLGYLIVPQALTGRISETLRRFGLKAGAMPQQALAEFMESGEFYRHLRRVRRIYGDRRRYLLDRLARDFADWGSFTDHQAGMQIVFRLRGGLDDREICARARALGLDAGALSDFCAAGERQNGLILGCCQATEEELDAALETLSQAISTR
ncbi:MocR-like pyridoxine biosynthesis transcription factor PdxR [Roseobacteraceae bacterium NS-SX3]